jgi:hypothetical protein
MLQCVVLASAALLVLAAIPIGREALDGPLTIGITAVALPLLIMKRFNTLWIIGAAAALSFTGSITGVARSHRHMTPMLVENVGATQISQAEPVGHLSWVQLFHDGVVGNGFDHLTRVRCGRVGSSGLGTLASA